MEPALISTPNDLAKAYPDLVNQIMNQSFLNGRAHSIPSPETVKKFKDLESRLDKQHDDNQSILLMVQSLKDIPEKIDKLNESLINITMKLNEMSPVKTIVYGATGTILFAAFSSMVYQVIAK